MGINLGSIGKIAGAVVGTYFGGPVGTAIGSKVGEMAGNTINGKSSKTQTASNGANPLNLIGNIAGSSNGSGDLLGSALNLLA